MPSFEKELLRVDTSAKSFVRTLARSQQGLRAS